MPNTAISAESPAAKAVRLLGGPVRTAERLKVERYQTVQSWVKHQIPAVYCPQIVLELGNEVKLWELRPDDWYRYWPSLVGTDGAPAVPESANDGEKARA
jgi:hypothetical protein